MRHLTAAAVLVCLSASLVSAAPPQKWEYAMIFTTKEVVLWKSATESFSEVGTEPRATMYPVYQKMGGKTVSKDKVALIDLLNVAGANGWELVNSYVDSTGAENFFFKRQVR